MCWPPVPVGLLTPVACVVLPCCLSSASRLWSALCSDVLPVADLVPSAHFGPRTSELLALLLLTPLTEFQECCRARTCSGNKPWSIPTDEPEALHLLPPSYTRELLLCRRGWSLSRGALDRRCTPGVNWLHGASSSLLEGGCFLRPLCGFSVHCALLYIIMALYTTCVVVLL
jgi:hypothetical protein